MYSCTASAGIRGGGAGDMCPPPPPPPPKVAVCVLKYFEHYMYGNGLVEMWGVLDGLGCFNGPHYGYANRSNSLTSLPRATGSPTDSQAALLRAVG